MSLIEYKYELILNCPNAKETDITYDNYYRITKNQDITDKDFMPQYWSQPENVDKKFKGKECEYQGFSCFATLDEAKNMLNRYSALGNYIYKAKSLEEYATIKDIGRGSFPTHANVYVHKGIEETKHIVWELEK